MDGRIELAGGGESLVRSDGIRVTLAQSCLSTELVRVGAPLRVGGVTLPDGSFRVDGYDLLTAEPGALFGLVQSAPNGRLVLDTQDGRELPIADNGLARSLTVGEKIIAHGQDSPSGLVLTDVNHLGISSCASPWTSEGLCPNNLPLDGAGIATHTLAPQVLKAALAYWSSTEDFAEVATNAVTNRTPVATTGVDSARNEFAKQLNLASANLARMARFIPGKKVDPLSGGGPFSIRDEWRAIAGAQLSLIRLVPPVISPTLGLIDRPECSSASFHDAVILYLQGLDEGTPEKISAGAFLLNLTLKCIPANDALRINSALSTVMRPISSLPPTTRTRVRSMLLPLILIVLDNTKQLGTTPLQAHVVEHFEEFAAPFADPRSDLAHVGLFLPSVMTATLSHVGAICEFNWTSGCVSGKALLRGLVDPLAIGFGECGAQELVQAPVDARLGAYSCLYGMCAAAATRAQGNAADLLSKLPPSIATSASQGTLINNVTLDMLNPMSVCQSASTAGGGTPSPGETPVQCLIGALPSAHPQLACLTGSLSNPARIFTSRGPGFVDPVCARSQSSADTSDAGSSSKPVFYDNTDEVQKQKAIDIQNLRDPTVQAAAATTSGYSAQEASAAMNSVADDLASGNISVRVYKDGKLGITVTDASGKTKVIMAYANDHTIVIDKDVTDLAHGPTDSNSLGMTLMHEAMHIAFSRMTRSRDEDRDHQWMDKSGIAWPSGHNPRESCSASGDDCAGLCSATSLAMREFLSCSDAASSPPQPRPGAQPDPSPLDPWSPDFSKAITQCLTPPSVFHNPVCPYTRCPNGRLAQPDGNGNCACLQGQQSFVSSMPLICQSVRCADFSLSSTLERCGCVANGSLTIDGNKLLTRSFGSISIQSMPIVVPRPEPTPGPIDLRLAAPKRSTPIESHSVSGKKITKGVRVVTSTPQFLSGPIPPYCVMGKSRFYRDGSYEVYGMCHSTLAGCRMDVPTDGAACTIPKGFWCWLGYDHEGGRENVNPEKCWLEQAPCEESRAQFAAGAPNRYRDAVSDRCLFLKPAPNPWIP